MTPDMKLKEFDLALSVKAEENKLFQEEKQAKRKETAAEAKKETSSPTFQINSFQSSSIVKLQDFTSNLLIRLHALYAQ